VYASAGRGIREELQGCEIIFGVDNYDPNSSLLTVRHMRALAEGNLNPAQPVNYSGNLFSDVPPANGQPATEVQVYYHAYSQSAWRYDPVSQTYLRLTDQADASGALVPATERLTGRQQAFENVIVILAAHLRIRHNQLEIDLSQGQRNYAVLFRDGQAYAIRWSTVSREWEKKSGLRRPLYFLDTKNNPLPLHPGRTWIHLVTEFSSVSDQGNGRWLVTFAQPYDPEDTPEP
jgi:hypothetical protein